MKQFELDFSDDPSFNTVVDLSNRTFDGTNIVSGRGATEDQLLIVYNKIKELQDWIDENGCTDDPCSYIRQQIEELAIRIEACCNTDHSEGVTQQLMDKLDDLEARIEGCCNRNPYEEGGGGGGCDGNVITVSFGWNGTNPFADGGQATAVSADTSRQIAAYYFLVYDGRNGIYRRSSTAFGGDWVWSINSSGSVTASHAGAVGPGNELVSAKEIIAVDAQGCEGGTPISLPISHANP